MEHAAPAERGDETPVQDTGFERALEGLQATGASVTVRELVMLLASHGTEEGRILAEYERVSSSASDPAARYLVDLIMEDERRHHRMLVELATTMAWESLDNDTSVPLLGLHIDEDLAAATRRLLEYEETDRQELQSLKKKLRPFEESTLWGLIVQLIIMDTEKHATILKFLERHARHG